MSKIRGTKFARLMRLFAIHVAESKLKPSLEHFNVWDLELLLMHTVSYILPYNNYCEMRMTHQENQHGWFYASHMGTVYILPSLQKSGVNIVHFTVFGKKKFASFLGR